jgi:branched-chain amino acid aminotransferase
MNSTIYYNGKFHPTATPLIGADSRALRYGDGLFETMKMLNGAIQHEELHFSRLFEGLAKLGFELPKVLTRDTLREDVLQTARRNQVEKAARIRMAFFRKDGGLYDPESHIPNLLIQAWPLPQQSGTINVNGLVTGVFELARKSCDTFSNIKSASHLPYVLAALHAKKMKWNDAFVLNAYNRLSDSSIANIFIVSNKTIYTPPLSEGCVAGIMRRYLLRELPGYGFDVEEKPLSVSDLENADECFLTNAISGIRWVGQFDKKTFANNVSRDLFDQFIAIPQ